MRLTAVRYMRVLLRLGVEKYHEWAIELLVRQLRDADRRVGLEALSVLQEACDLHAACLDATIRLVPNAPEEFLRFERGNSIVLRFLSRPEGFTRLSELGYLKSELKRWAQTANVDYVLGLEAELAELSNADTWKQRVAGTQDVGGVLPAAPLWRACQNRAGLRGHLRRRGCPGVCFPDNRPRRNGRPAARGGHRAGAHRRVASSAWPRFKD